MAEEGKGHAAWRLVESGFAFIVLVVGSVPGLAMTWRWALYSVGLLLFVRNGLDLIPGFSTTRARVRIPIYVVALAFAVGVAWPLAGWISSLGSTDRHLSASQKSTLQDALAPLKSLPPITVMVDSQAGPEAARFAHELYAFLVSDGVPVNGVDTGFFTHINAPLAVEVEGNSLPPPWTPQILEGTILTNALIRAKVLPPQARTAVDPSMHLNTNSKVELLIGAQ